MYTFQNIDINRGLVKGSSYDSAYCIFSEHSHMSPTIEQRRRWTKATVVHWPAQEREGGCCKLKRNGLKSLILLNTRLLILLHVVCCFPHFLMA